MTRNLEGRLAKLEIANKPNGCVIHVCDMPRSESSCAAFNQWAAVHRPGARVAHVITGVRGHDEQFQ